MNKCPTCNQEIKQKIARNDIWKVVQVYKMASGFKQGDKSWDSMYFSRYTRPAKQLIAFLGSWEWAADCVQELYEKFENLSLTVTFETILKHSASWKKDKLEQEERKNGIQPSQGLGNQSDLAGAVNNLANSGTEPRVRFRAI